MNPVIPPTTSSTKTRQDAANFINQKKQTITPSPQQQKTGQAKVANNIKTGNQTMTKTARAQLMQKVAASEQFDREQAFEVGFAKAAHDVGLSKEQFQQMYAYALHKLSSQAK
jgi:nitrate reductase beta subunit